jgi:hypothetical protein
VQCVAEDEDDQHFLVRKSAGEITPNFPNAMHRIDHYEPHHDVYYHYCSKACKSNPVWIFNRDLNIALIMAAAMIFNLLVASFFGTLIPLLVSKLKRDPATSATVFITTATDVLGFLFFLGLASLVLR